MFRAFVCLLAVCATTLVHARNEGVTADEIRLGASVVLSGPLGPQTAQYGEGSRLLFDAVNAQGGVHGRMIRYTTLDDAFDPQKADGCHPAADQGAAHPVVWPRHRRLGVP